MYVITMYLLLNLTHLNLEDHALLFYGYIILYILLLLIKSVHGYVGRYLGKNITFTKESVIT